MVLRSAMSVCAGAASRERSAGRARTGLDVTKRSASASDSADREMERAGARIVNVAMVWTRRSILVVVAARGASSDDGVAAGAGADVVRRQAGR